MQRQIKRGSAANAGLIFHVFAQDSTSTTGAGKTALIFSDFTCYYIRNGEAISGAITPQDIATIGTYAAPTANTNIRIKKVDDTNMPGVYEVQIHADWVNVTNSCQSLTIFLKATGMAMLPIQIQLVGVDPQTDVWDEAIASHLGAGSTGAALNAAGAAGDPWLTNLPGGYLAGTAGYIVGTNLDDTISNVANTVWDEAIGGHLGAGSTGASLNAKLEPTTAGRKLDVSLTGEAGLDFNNIGQASGPTTLSNITVPIVTTAQNLLPAERTAIADALLDEANGIETGVTPRQAIRGTARTQLGILSGAGTNNVKIRDLINSKDAIDAQVDAVGNRTSVSVDWT